MMTEHKQINVHTSAANLTEQVPVDAFNNWGAERTKFNLSILVYFIQWGLSHWNKNSDAFTQSVFFFKSAHFGTMGWKKDKMPVHKKSFQSLKLFILIIFTLVNGYFRKVGNSYHSFQNKSSKTIFDIQTTKAVSCIKRKDHLL